MNPPAMSPYQTIANVCVAIAALIFLLPLQSRLWAYAQKNLNNDEWVTPVLFSLIPLWLVLMAALLCVTASGGFDWLRLGRPALHTLAVSATLSLGVVSFVFIALYIRPGFTPRIIYTPVIYLVPFATMLLVVLSLNPKLAAVISPQVIRLPWTIFAALSLVACLGFFGYRLVHTGVGSIAGIVHRILNARQSSPDQLAKIATLDPQDDFGFEELLDLADVYHDRVVLEAASARLRSLPNFTTRLAAKLESSKNPEALEFIEAATLSPDERAKLALPTRSALERFTEQIPAPNYMSPERRKQLLKWGRKTFPTIAKKFEGTGVDFTPTLAAFEHALRPDDSR
ncbi:MAG: hypothetical protein ABIZ81_02435 [Opitutaceae bacterium]